MPQKLPNSGYIPWSEIVGASRNMMPARVQPQPEGAPFYELLLYALAGAETDVRFTSRRDLLLHRAPKVSRSHNQYTKIAVPRLMM